MWERGQEWSERRTSHTRIPLTSGGFVGCCLSNGCQAPVKSLYFSGRFAPAMQEEENAEVTETTWLPPRDSNPDMLIQSQLSCR